MIQVLRETHETPRDVQERVTRAGGHNILGEPAFRAVWGWSRLTWIGGEWTDRDSSGNVLRRTAELRLEPKYLPHNRWHIERWMPPESYGPPAQWYANTVEIESGMSIPALGPFPHRGEYEHCFTLAGPSGEYIPLLPGAVEYVVRAILWARTVTKSKSREAVIQNWERRERNWSQNVDAALELGESHAEL
jgi:hypothetical protein